MLSENFATALREIRLQMQALVKENEVLHKRIDELSKEVEQSSDRVFRQQSKRIRQAAAANDFDSLEALNSGAISPADAELIRLTTPAETIQPIQVGTPNNALVANMIAAAREGRIAPLPQEKPLPNNRNIERAYSQLKANSTQMAAQAELQRNNQERMDAIAIQKYKEHNNALGQRNPNWGVFDNQIIDY